MRILYLATAFFLACLAAAKGQEVSGEYLETRTCDVYTGPCFANGQVGITGKDALMAWSIDSGSYQGVDLSGLKVIMAVRATDTLGFGGGVAIQPDPIKSVVLVDERADARQRAALVALAKERAGRVAGTVVRVEPVAIEMSLDFQRMEGKLSAGDIVSVETRKLGVGDCVCTNERVFYPPLTDVDSAEPAYTVVGTFKGRGLGSRWEAPRTRSSFLATFRMSDEPLAAR
jgi:hypothetical protein